MPRERMRVGKTSGTYAQGRGPLEMLLAMVETKGGLFNVPATVINHDIQINQRDHSFTRRRDNSRLRRPLEVVEKPHDQHTRGHGQRAGDEEGTATEPFGDDEDEEGACDDFDGSEDSGQEEVVVACAC